jgi:D-alanyl-D-alanine carboxypeptidase
LIGRGARGAGYATYARGRHQVVVSVMVNDPPNSDIRVANVNIDRGTLTLADWQYTV